MNRHRPALGATLALLTAAATPRAHAQGTFTNFETPQTHPIEVVTINGSEYVLVCNTPDNSLEVWTATASPTKLARVSVGMGPGTVRFNQANGRAYVCNFDGDSISLVSFSGSGTGLTAQLERTTHVGDEPADVAFDPTSSFGVVTLSSRGTLQLINPVTLSLYPPSLRLEVDFKDNNGMYGSTSAPLAVKTPRQIEWRSDVFVLNFMGDQAPSNPGATFYDVDLWRLNYAALPSTTPNYLGQVGTTNHAFALNAAGDRMFVVGTRAQNVQTHSLAQVSGVATGFVQSWLTVVDTASGGNMTIRAEAASGVPPVGGFTNSLPSINLNRNYAVGGSVALEVAPSAAIVQPTGIDLVESGSNVSRIALTGYHSDNVALLTPLPTPTPTPGGYTIANVAFTPPSGYGMVGPRGVAFNSAGTLLFVHGRLDNTLRVVDAGANVEVATRSMQDPTPPEIRTGRKFLYSTRFSLGVNSPSLSGSGFVSCASCHVDGRTDGLLWNLSDPPAPPTMPVPGPIAEALPANSLFPAVKNEMMTQTLQGLINYPTNETFQSLATNEPLHWRADKNGFNDFNEAFVNLQRMNDLPVAGTQGISDAEMTDFRRFVFTIRHPPNPEEALDRRTTGKVPANPNDFNPTSANGYTGSALGRVLFHNNSFFCGTCVNCHSLPDGSSNTITEALGVPFPQPLETAALRNLRGREGVLHTSPAPILPASIPTFPSSVPFPGTATVANRGLMHDGGIAVSPVIHQALSIDAFISLFFFPTMPANQVATGTLAEACEQTEALVRFVRELDSGVAPLAGYAYTIDPTLSPPDSGANKATLDALEEQVKQANIGLGVYTRSTNGTVSGFWFDPLAGYRSATTPLATAISRTALLANSVGSGGIMIVQGTPLGTERRWSAPTGVGVPIINPSASPTNIVIESMAPDTFYEGITDMNRSIPTNSVVGTKNHRIEELHKAIYGPTTGVPNARRHEPPRRFRVSGTDIRPGARLFLFMTDGTSQTSFFPVGMELTLWPTKFVGTNQQPIWETELELDQLQTFAFLAGGPLAPGVQALMNTFIGQTTPLPPLDPSFNQYKAVVLNEDGTLSSITPPAFALSVRDTR